MATMVLAAACTGTAGSPPAPPTFPAPSISTTTAPPIATSSPTTTAPPGLPSCLAGPAEFTAAGIAGTVGQGEGDAARLSDLRLGTFDDCERLTLRFATDDGAPATNLGLTGVDVLREANVVRISLADAVAATAIADIRFDSRLVGRTFVVQDDRGALFVDVHLAAAASARADLFTSPARLVLDLRPEVTPPRPAPIVSASSVVVAPTESGVGYPLRISGYVRARAAEVTVELTDGGDDVEQTVAASTYPWRAFTVIFTTGPIGNVVLRVGDLETVIAIG